MLVEPEPAIENNYLARVLSADEGPALDVAISSISSYSDDEGDNE
jgi:hypothetical protein